MSPRMVAGIAVHILTASGVLAGLLALDFAAKENWPAVFGCLGAALAIDGIDGPLARRCQVDESLPRYSGVRLDLVVDYLNYCVVPAFIVLQGHLVPEGAAIGCAALILLTSLFHFADRENKTADGYFVGFPAAWNIIVFYVTVFGLAGGGVLAVVLVFACLTFVPVKWAHPFRVKRLRGVTFLVVLAWSAAAAHVILTGFPGHAAVQAVFTAAAAYFAGLGLVRTGSH